MDCDPVAVASQIGRLDFVSALLAIIAIILGAAAIPLFVFLKYRAEQVAKSEIASHMEGIRQMAEAEAISKVEQQLPILVEQYMELVQNRVAAEAADAIAGAQENDGNGNDVQPHSGGSAEHPG